MNIIQLHPLVELRRFCNGCLRVIRRTPNVDAELMFDGAKAIAEDITTERLNHDGEIIRLIEKAQDPKSPGGRNITPVEALPIQRLATETCALLRTEINTPRPAA